jgi:hypothetical protein
MVHGGSRGRETYSGVMAADRKIRLYLDTMIPSYLFVMGQRDDSEATFSMTGCSATKPLRSCWTKHSSSGGRVDQGD